MVSIIIIKNFISFISTPIINLVLFMGRENKRKAFRKQMEPANGIKTAVT